MHLSKHSAEYTPADNGGCSGRDNGIGRAVEEDCNSSTFCFFARKTSGVVFVALYF